MSVTLEDIKKGLLITDDYRDDELQMYLDDVVGSLRGAGVPDEKINKGIVVIGVRDLFYGDAGNTKFSDYFIKRASQLALGE